LKYISNKMKRIIQSTSKKKKERVSLSLRCIY
jgi:hypothetical protein